MYKKIEKYLYFMLFRLCVGLFCIELIKYSYQQKINALRVLF